jgi:hypothetical protein
MAKAAWSGPLVTFGNRSNPAAGGSNNPDQGPGAMLGGNGLIDPRVNYNVTRKGWIGIGVGDYRVLSAVPKALGLGTVAAAANVVNGTPMALAGASTGITVVPAGGFVPPGNPSALIPAGSLVLDGNPALINYGLADSNGNYNNNAYDNSSLLSRAISITGVGAGAGGNFLVTCADAYGYTWTQLVTVAAGVNTVATLKAAKFVLSIVPQFTDAHNYSVNTTDVFGLPVRAAIFSETIIHWNETLITANAGFVGAVATSPSTNLLGDVRGTYAVQSASDGAKRLTIRVSPGQVNLGTAVGVFGVNQA